MNEYPSSLFMRRILWGLKNLFLIPIYSIIIGLFMFFFLQSNLGTIMIVICVLALGIYGFILYNTFRYKRKILKELYPFARCLQYGVILWAIGAITLFIMLMSITDNPGNASFDSLLIPLLLFTIGYAIVGSGYRELASNKDMNGAKAAYIGCFSLVALVAIRVLTTFILSPTEMSSTLFKNCKSVALLLGLFCLYAIFDGTRALVYSVEAIEKGDEEDEEEEATDD